VPDAIGAEANFWRTNTTSRTVTLDGNKTVGILTFASPASYTISPGTGGTLVMNNSSGHAILRSDQGNHNLGVGVNLSDGLDAEINAGTFTIGGVLSGIGGVTKTGAGTLALSSATNFNSDLSVVAGTLRLHAPIAPDSYDVYLATGAALNLNFSGSADAIDSLFIDGVVQVTGIWGAVGSGAQYTSPLITGSGRLQVLAGPLSGDYNGDGAVNAADYIVWRKNVGSATLFARDPNNSGNVGTADYNSWRAHFGQSAESGAASAFTPAVPEPATAAIALLALLALPICRRRSGRSSQRASSRD
jgi:autotransporter-associated beta strand protein